MNKVACWALIALLMASCSQQPQNITSPTSVAFVDSPLPTNTVFSKPLITPTISRTPHPIPTETMTSTFDPTYLTQEAVVSACAATERAWYTKHLSSDYFTNGPWSAVVCSDNGIYTKVTNASLNLIREIPAVYDVSDNPTPFWYWKPFLWSPDGKYLYMEPECLCFIDSPWLIYASGFGLSRLDLLSGQFDVWLEPSHNPWYNFAFSPDANLFAFTPPDFYQIIRIKNLLTGEEKSISLKEKYNILEYRWTPDNSRLVVFTEEHVNNSLENGFSIFVYSVKSDALIKIVDKNNLNFAFPTEGYIEPRMAISDLTNDALELADTFGENKFQINIRSGEFISILETTTPTP